LCRYAAGEKLAEYKKVVEVIKRKRWGALDP
jgi:hypothetical protein